LKRSNPWYLFIGDLASDGAVWYHLVVYGGEKFVSKNVSKDESGVWLKIVVCVNPMELLSSPAIAPHRISRTLL